MHLCLSAGSRRQEDNLHTQDHYKTTRKIYELVILKFDELVSAARPLDLVCNYKQLKSLRQTIMTLYTVKHNPAHNAWNFSFGGKYNSDVPWINFQNW